jgi:5-bromo-4-chloroindolyl phosphate hydrolysis protein
MYETFFVIGLFFSLILAVLVLIPIIIGAFQFWLYYIKLLRGIRKKDEGGDKVRPTP